jgi:uncharacterized protein (DUF1697 family)
MGHGAIDTNLGVNKTASIDLVPACVENRSTPDRPRPQEDFFMSIQVALLRGINVGGKCLVAMADLRALVERLGYSGVRTLLQSGNLVFEGGRRKGVELERLLEIETARRLDVTVDYVIRSAKEWQEVIADNPFPKEARLDPSHLVVVFLKAKPQAQDVQALEASIQGPERLQAMGKQLYIVYPTGIGQSKLTGTLIERKLGLRGTARNWNTVMKLAALCE